MVIGILKEILPEKRVSLLPEQVTALLKKQVQVVVEEGAGESAFASNLQYTTNGAKTVTRTEVFKLADILLSINALPDPDILMLAPGKIMLGVYQPLYKPSLVDMAVQKQLTVFSLDMLPRSTRAQSMDVLSSQANIAGYRAVLLAAQLYPKYFPMLMTAAGSIAPAKVLIIGAGVAGLQAIATARRMGAVVEVFDTRPTVKEEVMSLGAKFVEVEGAADASKAGGYGVEQTDDYKGRQEQKISESIVKADIVITTAQIPGKKAPLLITSSMVNKMKKGSVIIDLAASSGGNCQVTKNNETINYDGVTIAGYSNLASQMQSDASKLYGKNILNFLELLIDKDKGLNFNFDDDIIKETCVCYKGEIISSRMK